MMFKELNIDAYFNTKPARYVKVTNTTAVVVGSSLFKIGDIQTLSPDLHVIKLYDSLDILEDK